MIPNSDRILATMADSVAEANAPGFASVEAWETARLIGVLLAELRVRQGRGRAIVQRAISDAPEVVSAAIGVLVEPRLDAALASLMTNAARINASDSEATHREIYEAIAADLTSAVKIAGEIGGASGRKIEDAAAEWERKLLDELLNEQASLAQDPGAEKRTTLTQSMVQAWLDDRQFLGPEARLAGPVRRMPGGFSKGTYKFDLDGQKELPAAFVIRRNEFPVIDITGCFLQENEYKMMGHFYRAGIRLPKVIAFEAATGVLGGDVTLMECAPGVNIGNVLGGSGFTEAMAKDMARVLASLHALPLDRDELVVTEVFGNEALEDTVGERNRQLLKEYYAYWQRSDVTPSPIVARVFNWLWRNLPDDSAPACFIHGDFGLHNILFEGDRVSAVLDWETTQIGDPAQEVAYLRDSIAALMPWELFLAYYEKAGGRSFDPATLQYHLACRWLRNAVMADVARRRFEKGSVRGLSMAWLGTTVQPQFLLKANAYANL